MRQVTFTLCTLTPLFLAGADPESGAELRAPAFRGLMRYWYRALTAGLVGATEQKLPQVIKAETAVFGATDTGSTVSIRVSGASKEPQRFKKESYSRENVSGRDYLLWSMAASGKGDRYKPDRLFFPPNTTFRVTLTSKGNSDDSNIKLQQAVAAFWLLTHLGALGSRSRRCAGSLTAQVIAEDTSAESSFKLPTGLHFEVPRDINALHRQLSIGIKTARTLVSESLDSPVATLVSQSAFDTLAPKVCRLWILRNGVQSWKTSEAAMRAIGSNLQIYRRGLPLAHRTVFGLPLIGVENRLRNASPLLLRIVELQEGNYVGLAVLFKTGTNQQYHLIERWADNFSGRIEVEL